MERKLVQHGESTLMVSLPKKWTKSQNLNKGDSVDISALPGKLIISKNKIKTKERVEKIILNTSNYENARTILGELYRRGIDRIEIEFKDSKTIYYIQLIVKSMAGFEIITQNDFSCVLKRLLKETAINLDELQNKMINIIKAESIMIKEYLD